MAFQLNKLRARLVELGMTIRDLAPKIGLSEGIVYEKFSGKCKFSREDIEKICKVLNINPLDYFFDL